MNMPQIDVEIFQQSWKLTEDKYLRDDLLLTEKEFNITQYPVDVLLKKLKSNQLTSLETTIAFIKKSIITSSKVNRDEFLVAIATAQYLDWYYATHRKTMGPLHGLPISDRDAEELVKDKRCYLGHVPLNTEHKSLNTFVPEDVTSGVRRRVSCSF
ncbi:hypothetical protein G210_1899 [Candida maltosa Xu316]|uniref:Uncharacterized protein n=1 Tax=Candida maltosa (strain Xu316) TaxID=1245528 RepID=M3J6J8_CANMX|nr:hypothetical protein G210_1899 [Candida maltosa Xu316]